MTNQKIQFSYHTIGQPKQPQQPEVDFHLWLRLPQAVTSICLLSAGADVI
jgi:hypothetical protein